MKQEALCWCELSNSIDSARSLSLSLFLHEPCAFYHGGCCDVQMSGGSKAGKPECVQLKLFTSGPAAHTGTDRNRELLPTCWTVLNLDSERHEL